MANAIRDKREAKGLSEDDVAAAAGLTYSQFVRIQAGSPRTTDSEIDMVLKTINKMKAKDRKLAGRPFKDPKLQAAVAAARESGMSVAEVIAATNDGGTPAPAKKTAGKPAAKPEDDDLIGEAPAKPKPRGRRVKANA